VNGERKTETSVILRLSEEEAYILSQLVQNSQVPPEDEPDETSKLRQSIFDLCKPSGIRG